MEAGGTAREVLWRHRLPGSPGRLPGLRAGLGVPRRGPAGPL